MVAALRALRLADPVEPERNLGAALFDETHAARGVLPVLLRGRALVPLPVAHRRVARQPRLRERRRERAALARLVDMQLADHHAAKVRVVVGQQCRSARQRVVEDRRPPIRGRESRAPLAARVGDALLRPRAAHAARRRFKRNGRLQRLRVLDEVAAGVLQWPQLLLVRVCG